MAPGLQSYWVMKRLSTNRVLATVLLAVTLVPPASFGHNFSMSPQQLAEVMKVAHAISVVNPTLDDSKYLEYASGIYKASQRYGIDPTVLIAITQQETGFRENLPEGKAGEIGIIQIRKNWLKQPRFAREFKKQSVKDLSKPAKSFMYAAWILKELKESVSKSTLPYWSYYNSVRFENRFKYFLAVNRNIASLKRASGEDGRMITSDVDAETAKDTTLSSNEPKVEPKMVQTEAKPVQTAKRSAPPAQVVSRDRLKEGSLGLDLEGTRWIPDALRKIRHQQAKKALQGEGLASNDKVNNKYRYLPNTIRD
jgi:Transglycosylase SLT domain